MVKDFTMGGWTFYIDEESKYQYLEEKVGKWMYFFDENCDLKKVNDVCLNAVNSKIVKESKHTDFAALKFVHTGVACFYLNADDIDGHKKVIRFFLENEMIPRNKSGNYRNISFKLDLQTTAGDYGNNFEAKISLSQFIDLKTGEWI